MSDARSLPIPDVHRELRVVVDGTDVPRSEQLSTVTISNTANRIPHAQLIYLDGAASDGKFPLSDSGTFLPGAMVEIISDADNKRSLFKGIVVKCSIRVRETSASQFVV